MSNDPGKGPPNDNPLECEIVIGKVVSVNVPKRGLRIEPATSHPERFYELRALRLKTKRGHIISLAVAKMRVTATVVIAEVETDDLDLVASTRGALVVITKSERFRLPENEYYIDDVIGLVVKNNDGTPIGKLVEIWETPANDIFRIMDENGREMLVPAIPDFILKVDLEHGEIVVDTAKLRE